MDNQVVMPNQTNFVDPTSNSSSSSSNKLKEKEPEPETESTYDPLASFSNSLRSKKNTAQMKKIIEIFKQVKVNVPFLNAIEQVLSYAKIFKDFCTKKRAHQASKVFLAANISGIIQNNLSVVGCLKITEDKISDANLPNAEVAFQPQTRTSRPLSDAEVVRRGPRVSTQTRA